MAAELDNPAFQDDDLAREWFEARIWPNGPLCPHCGSFGEGVTKLSGKAHRPGLYQCNACREQFTVTVGTVMERSKIGLHIWLKAMYLLSASKKGMSTHQLHRMLGVSLKSTWFLMHRIREAMRALNEQRQNEDLLLKIGIHEGPCLAVTLNDRQDYFGQTVNIASRVQCLAVSRSILATGSIVDHPQASELLEADGIKPTARRLPVRGVADEMAVYEIP